MNRIPDFLYNMAKSHLYVSFRCRTVHQQSILWWILEGLKQIFSDLWYEDSKKLVNENLLAIFWATLFYYRN